LAPSARVDDASRRRDGIGIIVGAGIGAGLALPFWRYFLLEYALGFGFGWALFQAFAMRDMAGGSYPASLKMTFLPELLSMNLLMTRMVLTSQFAMAKVEGANDPARPQFWFMMSMALIIGSACAYPINWWLVANHMKHGMLIVRREPETTPPMDGMTARAMSGEISEGSSPEPIQPSSGAKAAVTVLTFAILGCALVFVVELGL
jgi:hypothetical protein